MDESRIAFHGTLQELLAKVERGEMVPKLQASHAPPCKFWTAFQVLNGIRHMAPVIHGPKGCTYSVASNYKMRGCEYRGVPLEPTTCTAQNEADVVYGGEGKLLEAVKEADQRYHPELIVILSCCCSGITGDDVEMVAEIAGREVRARVLAIRSEGFGGDFRSGYEDAFRVLMDLMEPRGEVMKGTVNIIGAREGPTYTEWTPGPRRTGAPGGRHRRPDQRRALRRLHAGADPPRRLGRDQRLLVLRLGPKAGRPDGGALRRALCPHRPALRPGGHRGVDHGRGRAAGPGSAQARQVIREETAAVDRGDRHPAPLLRRQDGADRDLRVPRPHPRPLAGQHGRGVRRAPHHHQPAPLHHQGAHAQHQVPACSAARTRRSS